MIANLFLSVQNLAQIDVYCIHTEAEYDRNFTKDLSVRVLEEAYESVLKPELWPSKVSISVDLGLKQITIKGSLKLTRAENFYGFDEKNPERKEKRKLKKEEKVQKKLAKEAMEAKQQGDQAEKSDEPAKADQPAEADQPKKNEKPTKSRRKRQKKASGEGTSNDMETGESSK